MSFRQGGEFVLHVEDDGPGFELTRAKRHGLGLVMGLAGQIGGRLTVERRPKTRCTVHFPDRNTIN